MAKPRVSVCIVTYNHGDCIERTIRSLVDRRGDSYELSIEILDNQSTDDVVAIVRRLAKEYAPTFPNLKVECLPANLGFGRAQNLGLARANSDFHLICNPDLYFDTDVVGKLLEFALGRPQLGIATPKVLNPDGTVQGLNKRLPTVWDLAVRRFIPKRWLPKFEGRIERYEMRDVGYDKVVSVPFMSGCFMFGRTEALRRVNGFDDRFFLYFEDVDLTQRVRLAGYETLYCPDATIYHLWKRDAHKKKSVTWIMIKSAVKYFNRWGWRWA